MYRMTILAMAATKEGENDIGVETQNMAVRIGSHDNLVNSVNALLRDVERNRADDSLMIVQITITAHSEESVTAEEGESKEEPWLR
jgi:hypothetical protein